VLLEVRGISYNATLLPAKFVVGGAVVYSEISLTFHHFDVLQNTDFPMELGDIYYSKPQYIETVRKITRKYSIQSKNACINT
jgi:hypothetical protein